MSDKRREYHDPDYPEAVPSTSRQTPLSPRKKIQKVVEIVKSEFGAEMRRREEELDTIDQRLIYARKTLHRLRYAIVNSYYQNQKLQPSEVEIQEEVRSQQDIKASNQAQKILRNEQKRLHPSLRKLLGKKDSDIGHLITYEPRPRQRKDYSAMLISGLNTTVSEDKSPKSLRTINTPIKEEPSESGLKRTQDIAAADASDHKIPRYVAPTETDSIVRVNESGRNRMKIKYRILVGNTSRFIPPSSAVDRSTHRWLLYIRGPKDDPDVSHFITGVAVELHESYQPHHIVHLNRSPFHLSRRGWGEFPVKLEIMFVNPAINRPVNIVHNLKLDRKYTGLQTLGSETIVDVWLYADETMRKQNTESPNSGNIKSEESPSEQAESEPAEHVEDNNTEHLLNGLSCTSTAYDPDEVLLNAQRVKQEFIEEEQFTEVPMEEDFGQMNFKQEVEELNVRVKEEISEDSSCDLPPQISRDKRIIKCIDKNTGRILYLELNANLPLEKMNEIIINHVKDKANFAVATSVPPKSVTPNKKNGFIANQKPTQLKKGVSLLKINQIHHQYPHLQNDHCYLKNENLKTTSSVPSFCESPDLEDFPKDIIQDLSCRITRIEDIRCALNYLLRNLPIVTYMASNHSYRSQLPFTVSSNFAFHQYHLPKKRSIEWSRAKLVHSILETHFSSDLLGRKSWSTRQILSYARLHGFGVPSPDYLSEAGPPFDLKHISKGVLANPQDVCTLSRFILGDAASSGAKIKEETVEPQSIFEDHRIRSTDTRDSSSDEEVDVASISDKSMRNTKQSPSKNRHSLNEILPIADETERLQCLFIERTCSQLGIELRNEFIGNGLVHSVVHRTILSALKLFIEDLLRSSLALKISKDLNYSPSADEELVHTRPPIWSDTRVACESQHLELQDVYEAIERRSRLQFLTNRGLGERKLDYAENL